MWYAWDITIPANTLDNAPISQELKLTLGKITAIEIKFPSGCHGLVKVKILRWGFQLVPLSSDEVVTGDDETVPSETYYEMLEKPALLTFMGSSPSTTYDHRITVRINVEPLDTAQQDRMIELLEQILERLS